MSAKQHIELLSPAGSFESLQAAINGGANAIYFGVEQLNMRTKSSNSFTLEDIKEIKLVDQLGRSSKLMINKEIHLEGYKNGIYFMIIRMNSGNTIVRKIIMFK